VLVNLNEFQATFSVDDDDDDKILPMLSFLFTVFHHNSNMLKKDTYYKYASLAVPVMALL